MWDIRQIVPAEGPEKALVPLQEVRHAMKHFSKRPGTQSSVCFCCWCWIRFFHVFSLKAEFLLHKLPFIIHFHSQWLQKSAEEGEVSFCCQPLSWCRRKGGAAPAAGFWVPAPGIVPTAWGNPGCPKFSAPVFWHRMHDHGTGHDMNAKHITKGVFACYGISIHPFPWGSPNASRVGTA